MKLTDIADLIINIVTPNQGEEIPYHGVCIEPGDYDGNMFIVLSKMLGVMQYSVNVPFINENNNIVYNQTEMNNRIFGCINRNIKAGDVLLPWEVLYLESKGLKDQGAEAGLNFWTAKCDIKLRPQKDVHGDNDGNLDKAFYCRVSDVIRIELERTLIMDRQRATKPGFSGFAATNGAMLDLVSRYCTFGEAVNAHRTGLITYNTDYPVFAKGNLVDLANVSQDTKAIREAGLVLGVDIIDHRLVQKEGSHMSRSHVLSHIPYSKQMNATRGVVARALSQALPLKYAELSNVRMEGAGNVPGINVVTLRDDNYPQDSFKLSKSAARRFGSVRKVNEQYVVPRFANVVLVAPMVNSEDFNVASAMDQEAALATVRSGSVLFTYTRNATPMGGSTVQSLIMAEKEVVPVTSNKDMILTGFEVIEGYSKRDVYLVNITGYEVSPIRIGSKLMDRFGNKGTVNAIVDDEEMPMIKAGNHVLQVDMIYNPTIYKRKIALSYKSEEIQALAAHLLQLDGQMEQVVYEEEPSTKEILETNSELKVPTYIVGKDMQRTFKAGVHHVSHLDHAPERKLMYGWTVPKVSSLDRDMLRKLNVRMDKNIHMQQTKDLAYALDCEVTFDNDGIQYRQGAIPVTRRYNCITKRLNQNLLSEELSLVNKSDLEGTVADPEYRETWCMVRTAVGDVRIPPVLMLPRMTEWGGIGLNKEMVQINAIIAEQISLEYCQTRGLDTTRPMIRLRMLVGRFKEIMSVQLGRIARQAYEPRVPGCHGVGVTNTKLSEDVIGVPERILKWMRKHNFRQDIAVVRRNPIHRIFNTPVMKIIPVKGYALQLHPNTMKLMDGDSDGDLYELVFLNAYKEMHGVFDKYKPTSLWKGHTDIVAKKKNERRAFDASLGNSQFTLKMYTAIAGSVAIELHEVAKQIGYGKKEACELYHFMAQMALNVKHSGANEAMSIIQKLHAMIVSRKTEIKTDELRKMIEFVWPCASAKQVSIIIGLAKLQLPHTPDAAGMLLVRKRSIDYPYSPETANDVAKETIRAKDTSGNDESLERELYYAQ